MNRRLQGLLVGIIGVAALRLGLTGDLVFYVRERMRVPLVLGGLVLLVVGVATAWPRRPRTGAPDEHLPRTAWLLLVPVILLLAFTPGPLGADSAGNSAIYTPTAASEYGPLAEPRDGAIDMTMSELVERVHFDTEHPLVGEPVRVQAFVERGKDHGGDSLARYMIFCCAADAFVLRAHVAAWPGDVPPAGQWVEAVVQPRATAHDDLIVDVVRFHPIDEPSDPYLTP